MVFFWRVVLMPASAGRLELRFVSSSLLSASVVVRPPPFPLLFYRRLHVDRSEFVILAAPIRWFVPSRIHGAASTEKLPLGEIFFLWLEHFVPCITHEICLRQRIDATLCAASFIEGIDPTMSRSCGRVAEVTVIYEIFTMPYAVSDAPVFNLFIKSGGKFLLALKHIYYRV